MMQDAITRSLRNLAALDPAEGRSRLAELVTIEANAETGRARASERRQAINEALRPYEVRRNFAADGAAVAEALLAGADASEAAAQAEANREELERENEALRLGMSDLSRRIADSQQERWQIQQRWRVAVQGALEPFAAAIEERARIAAEVIVEADAMLSAVGSATRLSSPGAHVVHAALSEGVVPTLVRPTGNSSLAPEVAELVAAVTAKVAEVSVPK